MNIPPIQSNKPQPNFGILIGHKKTNYGDYMLGLHKDYKIEIFNAPKHKQKLIYVSDNKALKWIKSKLTYIQNGIKKTVRSEG